MRSLFKTELKLWQVVIFIICILVMVAGVIFFSLENQKAATLVGGFTAGMTVYLLSFIVNIGEYIQIEKSRNLGVKEVLADRRGRDYYKRIIINAKENVTVIGTTCTRFIEDFVDEENNEHILLDALRVNKKLKFSIMLPSDSFMDDRSLSKYKANEDKINKIIKEFPDQVELRRFACEARYSFVRVDDDLIVGPVFSGKESQHSPAIHLNVDSAYSQTFLDDFKDTWSKSLDS